MSILLTLATISLVLFGGFSLVSFWEGERRAASVSTALALAGTSFFILVNFLPGSFGAVVTTDLELVPDLDRPDDLVYGKKPAHRRRQSGLIGLAAIGQPHLDLAELLA